MQISRSSGDLIWVNTLTRILWIAHKSTAVAYFSIKRYHICRSDKIALFLVINLLNLECTVEYAYNTFFFLNSGPRFLQRKKRFIPRVLISETQIDISAERDKKRLAELTEVISFCAKYRKL